MSAFIVEDKTINRVMARFLKGRLTLPYFQEQLKEYTGIDAETEEEWEEKIAEAMYKLNVQAVEQRYGKGAAKIFSPRKYVYDITEASFSTAIQSLKALRCWQYQCSEGDIPESGLFRFFKVVEAILMAEIISALPEYEEAEWG